MNTTVQQYHIEKQEARMKAIDVHRFMIKSEAFPSCLNCDNWREADETCKLYNARPPAQVVVYSCGQQWVADIPF